MCGWVWPSMCEDSREGEPVGVRLMVGRGDYVNVLRYI